MTTTTLSAVAMLKTRRCFGYYKLKHIMYTSIYWLLAKYNYIYSVCGVTRLLGSY